MYSRALLLAGAGKVYALDFSPAMLKVAALKVERAELPPEWGSRPRGLEPGTEGTTDAPALAVSQAPAIGDVRRLYEGFVPLQARAEAVPLPDQSLDGVVVGGSWNEFPEPERVVQEMYRVLKPGGRLFVMFSHRSAGVPQRVLEWTGLRFPSLEELSRQLEAAGFQTRGWREGLVGFVSGTKVG